MNVLQFTKKSNKIKSELNYSSKEIKALPKDISAIGIDLGTTNSVVSIFLPDSKHPVTLKYENSLLVPSMVYFDSTNNINLIGLQAKSKLEAEPTEVIRSTKRSMGKNNTNFISNNKSYSPEEIASLILGYLVLHPTIQSEIDKFGFICAVITVPAHFDDAARLATIASAEKVGIHVLRIVNEPTAAALAYSMMPEEQKNQKETLVVFDFGGGTFDVSVVDRDGDIFNVISSEGDVNLGGDNIDEALTDFLLTKVHPQLIARRATKESELYRNLLITAEEAKKTLQSEGITNVLQNDLDDKGSSISFELNREQFEGIISPILEKTLYLTESAMHSAKRSPKFISRILLVGGSTRLNLVRKMLSEYFKCSVDARLEPDLAVSWGASLQSAIILGKQPDTILVDVCSHTLGIGVVENTESINENFRIVAKKFGIPYPITEQELHRKLGSRIEDFNKELQKLLNVAPILHRNSALPARKSEFFNTIYNNQHAVHVVVVQGDGDTVGENRLIGSFLFDLEQPCQKGTRCEIQLTYDVNGMVHVFARQLGTKNEAKAQFDSRTGEVIGWTSILKESENEKDNSTNNSNVLSFPSDRIKIKNKNQLIFNKSSENEIINSLILRTKRYLSHLETDSLEYSKISNLLNKYSNLLLESQKGDDNDSLIEPIEVELLDLLKGK